MIWSCDVVCRGVRVMTSSAALIARACDVETSRWSVRSMRDARRFSRTHALVPVSTSSMRVIMIASSLPVSDQSCHRAWDERR